MHSEIVELLVQTGKSLTRMATWCDGGLSWLAPAVRLAPWQFKPGC